MLNIIYIYLFVYDNQFSDYTKYFKNVKFKEKSRKFNNRYNMHLINIIHRYSINNNHQLVVYHFIDQTHSGRFSFTFYVFYDTLAFIHACLTHNTHKTVHLLQCIIFIHTPKAISVCCTVQTVHTYTENHTIKW